jgi:hypothetical protein
MDNKICVACNLLDLCEDSYGSDRPPCAIKENRRMKIIQLSVLQDSQLFALTDNGKIFQCAMDGKFNWREFTPISESVELTATAMTLQEAIDNIEAKYTFEQTGNNLLASKEWQTLKTAVLRL